ncbi:MAG TPA: hypothetical protein VEI01_14610 [Terriglobales bacterium]|nr:hypothetical protein [Terriglobales bacterium]
MALAIIPPWLEKLTSSDVSHSHVAAWWGAIVATIALGWNILRDLHLQGPLTVEGMYQVDSLEPSLPPVLTVRVTNVGSKPILVQGIAIELKKGSAPSHHFFPCEIPKMLARGKFFLQVLDRTGWLPASTEKLYAWDSNGRHWYMARKEFRRLVDEHHRFVARKSSGSRWSPQPSPSPSQRAQ